MKMQVYQDALIQMQRGGITSAVHGHRDLLHCEKKVLRGQKSTMCVVIGSSVNVTVLLCTHNSTDAKRQGATRLADLIFLPHL